MGELQEKMAADLKIGGYAVSTQKIYVLHAKRFARHFTRSPRVMALNEHSDETDARQLGRDHSGTGGG